jgi:flagellar basal-body rod modification protein FlgD
MTTTNTVNNNAVNNNAGAASKSITGNGDVTDLFTKLLVAQIKNQDPLSPQDPSQMVTQLTQLSQMESLQALSNQGTTQAALLSSLQMLGLGAQVGSTVQLQVSQLKLDATPVQTHFTLPSHSAKAQLVLTGSDGQETRVELGSRSVGANRYTLDPKALGLPAGSYAVHVENELGQQLPVEIEAELSGVRLAGNGTALLQLGGFGEFDPAAITQFKGRPATQS